MTIKTGEKNMRPKKTGAAPEGDTQPTTIVETSAEIERMDHLAYLATAIVNGATIERLRRLPKEHWAVVRKHEFPVIMGELIQGNVPITSVRVKLARVAINGHDVPEPMKEVLEHGEFFFYPDTRGCEVRSARWSNTSVDRARLKFGLVHKTEEGAQMHLKALLSFTLNDKIAIDERDEDGEY